MDLRKKFYSLKNETKPELEDFKRTIADYLSYEVGLILKNQTPPK
nr:hypothetical protein [Helicobacter pylori]